MKRDDLDKIQNSDLIVLSGEDFKKLLDVQRILSIGLPTTKGVFQCYNTVTNILDRASTLTTPSINALVQAAESLKKKDSDGNAG